MKTAQQWIDEITKSNGWGFAALSDKEEHSKLVEIQLDAFKAGMMYAAACIASDADKQRIVDASFKTTIAHIP